MIKSINDCLLQILFLAPFLFLSVRANKNLRIGVLMLAALMFILASVTTDLFATISIFEGQKWNWVGKATSLLIALIFIYCYKLLMPVQFGLTTKIERKDTKPLFAICAAYFILRSLLYFILTKAVGPFNFETILYQSTMPGITEEIVFRGILLALLNQALLNPKWIFAKVYFGWGALMTSLLFGFTHGVFFDGSYNVHFDFFAIARASFDGFLFALLVEKTKSLLPAIILHNSLNLIGNH